MSSEVSIKQLPQITEINNGDLILVQTPNSTNTLLFENFVIGLENTTFASTFNKHTTDIETLCSNQAFLSSIVDSVSADTSSDIIALSTFTDTISADVNILSTSFFRPDLQPLGNSSPGTTLTLAALSTIQLSLCGKTFNFLVSSTTP